MSSLGNEIKWFISHQWKEMVRSPFWSKNLVMNLLLGFLVVLMLLYLFALGLFIDVIFEQLFPDDNPVTLFNGILIYYFGFELIMRFFLQSLPTVTIESYLHLPIRKSSLIHYNLGKSLLVIGNYLSWLVVFPFAFKVIAEHYSLIVAWQWIIGIALLVFANNFLAIYAKRQLVDKGYIVGIFGLILISIALLNRFEIIELTQVSASLFHHLLVSPVAVLFPLVICISLYLLNYMYLRSRLYPRDFIGKKGSGADSMKNLNFLKSFGEIGHYIFLDLRLIWRHKRTRSIVFMAPIFLGYGFFFYPQEIYRENFTFLIFVGVFISGGLMVNYMNYCFSYESNYFDNILANYKGFTRYITSKYILGILISSICFVLTIPYLLFGMHVFFINLSAFLYNIGILSFLLLYIATYSTKRMDLSRNAAFNYQGLGATHWLAMIPAFLLPVLIYLPFGLADYPYTGLALIASLGLGGLIFHKSLLKLIHQQFMKRKYNMAEGFRD